jgi:hypothetical protein
MRARASRPGVDPIWTPGAVTVLVTSIALGVAAPLSVAAAEHDSSAVHGSAVHRVHVIVTGLPPGVRAPVTITGTGAAPRTSQIDGQQTVALVGRGHYRLLAAPVKVPAGTYFAAVPAESVKARTGPAATAIVNYADFLSSSTRILMAPAGDTVLLMDPPDRPGERLVLESKNAPSGIRPDVYVASGSAPGEPDGYLVKVNAELPAPPGEVEFDVSPADLPEVFEKAEINVSKDEREAAGPLPFTRAIPCRASAGAQLSIDVHALERSLSFRIAWGQQGQRPRRKRLREFRSATLGAQLGETVSGTLASSVDGLCDAVIPRTLIAPEWRLPLIVVPLPPLHVVIRPVVQVYVSGNISVTHQATLMFNQHAGVKIVATCARGSRCNAANSSRTANLTLAREQKQPGSKATAELAVTSVLHLYIYGLGGPHISAGGRMTLTVTPTSQRLHGCVEGGIGFEIRRLRIGIDKPRLLKACRDF